MKKLELDLNDLEVATFSAGSEETKRGTVKGNGSETCPNVCYYYSDDWKVFTPCDDG